MAVGVISLREMPARKEGEAFTAQGTDANAWAVNYIKRAREAAGLSGVQMSERLTDELGKPISGALLSSWEAGRVAITAAVLLSVSKITRTPILYPEGERTFDERFEALEERVGRLAEALTRLGSPPPPGLVRLQDK